MAWTAGAASAALRAAEYLVTRVPHRTVVVSKDLHEHFSQLGRQTSYIPNGVSPPAPSSPAALEAFGLSPGRYVLFVGRLVPEKAPDLLIRAFSRLETDMQLVIVGGSSFSDAYVKEVEALAAGDRRVRLIGYQFGERLNALYAHARLFVLPSALEGLPLTLLEAAAHGCPVLTSDIPPHVEVLRAASGGVPAKLLFRSGDEENLVQALRQRLVEGFQDEVEEAQALRRRTLEAYSWDRAVDDLERVYEEAVTKRV
jgi:glycosyltransferase involved in cell wall biosynthesis